MNPYLFIDDHLIERSANLTKALRSPERFLDGPVITVARHSVSQPFHTVVRDPETGRFRMWYSYDGHRLGEPGSPQGRRIAHVESDDAIHWGTPSPIEFTDGRSDSNRDACSVIDEGPGFADPDRRYKLAWHSKRMRVEEKPGLYVGFSRDGIRWTPCDQNPVLPDYASLDNRFPENLKHPLRAQSVCDIVDVYRDPIRGRYGLFFKCPAVEADGYAAAPRAYTLIRRLVSASVSPDLVRWEQPWRAVVPDKHAPGFEEYYCVGGTFARGDLLIGFLRVLRDDLSAEPGGPTDGIGYTQLVTSRDGVRWERHDGIFFDRNTCSGSWDRAFAWICCALPMRDELWLYYGGYLSGHKTDQMTGRQLGIAKMPIDRLVARRASGSEHGTLTTKPISVPAIGCALQLIASGDIRAAVLDASGCALPGYGLADDWLARPLDIAPEVPIRLEFEVRSGGELFGFSFVEHPHT